MADPYDFDNLWNYDDPAGTEEKFRALLPAAEAGGDAEYHLQLLTQIARTYSLRRMFEHAQELLATVEARLSDATPVARIRWLLESGRSYNSSGKKDQARALFLQAWELGTAGGTDFYAVDAAHMVAIVESDETALEWNLKAIEFAEQSSQERARGWLGSLLNNTAWTYHDMGDYQTALDLFQRALVFRQSRGDATTIRIARWCLGRCLRSLGRIEAALELQQALLADSQTAGDPDGYTHEELGELLLLKGQADEAGPHFKAAYTLLSQDLWLMENEADRMARIKRLAGSPIR